MTFTDTAPGPRLPAGAIMRVVLAASPMTVDALLLAATSLAGEPSVRWQLRDVRDVRDDEAVDIVLCGSAAAVRESHARWPRADILVLVAVNGSERSVVAALDAGAHVCVRGTDPAVVAAYLHAIARRRRLGDGR